MSKVKVIEVKKKSVKTDELVTVLLRIRDLLNG